MKVPLRTNDLTIERNLKWSIDGLLFFTAIDEGPTEDDYEDSHGRLYSLNMTNNRIECWAKQFNGEVINYALLQGGRADIVIPGQLSTEIQICIQRSVSADLVKQTGWNGSYESTVTAFGSNSSTIVFIQSSYEKSQEVCFIDNIDQLNMAQAAITENPLFMTEQMCNVQRLILFNGVEFLRGVRFQILSRPGKDI